MRQQELIVQAYLGSRELEHGQFLLSLIRAKISNRRLFIELRQPLTAEGYNMTPQEELFSELFNHEKTLVCNMELLELRAHREELAKIAFEARARLTAVDDEERQRKKKSADGKPTGFATSLQTDELTTNAINAIKTRQGRQTKEEKVLQGLMKLGMSQKDAEAHLSAGKLLTTLKSKGSPAATPAEVAPQTNKFVNPFAKQVEPEHTDKLPEVTIVEETNVVIVTKEAEVEKSKSFNPFAK